MVLGQVILDRRVMHAVVLAVLARVRLDADVRTEVNLEIRFRRADLREERRAVRESGRGVFGLTLPHLLQSHLLSLR